ncbi:protein CASPARIAN STRIP INTEGRITY FACTOR 1-like [Humulus lupulus]|uniref:protein CASPARIAN STRIP INTEGRITY FACTOR 1-like n=1 Tax=Humulus lupulus TaxID=3486 RepID=UPI002B40519D|nr:protein CASPARIAN STRIP INTEGRITY FACTOR 1-like [Humulus lupulus]
MSLYSLVMMKNISLIFLLISGSLLSTSLAGRQLNSGDQFAKVVMDGMTQEEEMLMMNKKHIRLVHERLLRSNTRDYGKYDPTPALVKPPFKLIPN